MFSQVRGHMWSTICVFVTASAAPWRRSNKISYSTIPAGRGHIGIREPRLRYLQEVRIADPRSSQVSEQWPGLVTRLVTAEPWLEVRSERPVTGGSGSWPEMFRVHGIAKCGLCSRLPVLPRCRDWACRQPSRLCRNGHRDARPEVHSVSSPKCANRSHRNSRFGDRKSVV